MKTIELKRVGRGDSFEIEVRNLNGVEIKLYSNNSRHAGLGLHYNVSIFTEDNQYHLGDIGEIRDGLDKFFMEQFYKQNINVTTTKEECINPSILLYKLILTEFDSTILKLKNKLELLESSSTDLRFNKISCISDDSIDVEYYGHEVGGSYVYDYQVTPAYIKTLQYETNRKVEWIGRKSGGFGSDIYTFKIFINKIIDEIKENEIIIGKRYHIDTTDCGGRQSPYAFRVSPGIEWAMMYSISEQLNNNKIIPNLIIKQDRIVNIYGIDIFKIIEDAWEKNDSRPNSGRTHFKGTFDLIINPDKFVKLYLKLYGELCGCIAHVVYPNYTSPIIWLRKNIEDKTSMFVEIGYLPTINKL